METVCSCMKLPSSMSPELLFLSYKGKPLPQLARILSEPHLMCFVVLPRRYSPNGRHKISIFKGFPRKLWRRMLLRVAVFQTYAFNFSESEHQAYVSKLKQLYQPVLSEASFDFFAPAGFAKGQPVISGASFDFFAPADFAEGSPVAVNASYTD